MSAAENPYYPLGKAFKYRWEWKAAITDAWNEKTKKNGKTKIYKILLTIFDVRNNKTCTPKPINRPLSEQPNSPLLF